MTDDEAITNLRLDALKKFRIVIRAAQRHSAWIEKRCGISGAQLWMLQELRDQPGIRVGQLATKLAIHQTTASNLLHELGQKGYVVKVRDTDDHRVVHLKLSKLGVAALAQAPKPARGLIPEAIIKLDERGLQDLNRALQELSDSMSELDEGLGMLPLPFTM